MVIGGGSGGLACSKEGHLHLYNVLSLFGYVQYASDPSVAIITYPSALTAALVGQNVAVLDYVEPSMKGNAKRESSLAFLTK